MLTAYNGQAISYDAIGNPTSYLGWNMTWQGRQLASATKDENALSFTYDANGIRTSKTVNGVTTEYFLNGSQILAQKTGESTMWFFYDQQGNRVGMADSSNHFYYYLYNLQGDVIAIADASTGKLVATYKYDAWGNCTVTNATGFTVGTDNPFRYRGYYYDTETGLYYLNSRYYDPEVGRFINADKYIVTDPQSVLCANTFAYCENNPVNNSDPSGEFLNTIFGAIFGAITAVITRDPRESWKQAAVRGAISGAIAGLALDACIATGGVAGLAIAIIGGATSGVYDKYQSKQNVGEVATTKELVKSGIVGAVVNLGFGSIGGGGKCVTGCNAKGVLSAMWQNTKRGFLSPKGNFVKSKALHTVKNGMFGAFSGSFITWYGNLQVGGL